MPAVRLLPDTATLTRWVEEEHLTHAEIAERVFDETGHEVSRSTISAALSRAGLTKQQNRYVEEIPWRVKMEHIREYPIRMLRLLGRRRAGAAMTDDENQRLDSWLAMLDSENAVVAYAPDSEQGFVYTERQPEDLADIPIRRQIVRISK